MAGARSRKGVLTNAAGYCRIGEYKANRKWQRLRATRLHRCLWRELGPAFRPGRKRSHVRPGLGVIPLSRQPAEAQLGHPRLPRVIRTVSRSIELSSPAPGRPKVFWMIGINPGMIRELWPSYERPYEERPLAPYLRQDMPGCPSVMKSYRLGTPKKLVVYDRAHPEIRLVLLFDSPYDRDSETWQPIVQSSVERDQGVDPKRSHALEQKLWDEICRVERRGRPRGTGHPKRRLPDFPLSPKYIDSLRKAGLDDKDLQILFGTHQDKTFKQIGRELGMSPQAAWNRWTRRIEPALKELNRQFSRRSFKLFSLDSK